METMSQERFPGEHDYFYPVIFEGEATGCTVSRGATRGRAEEGSMK